MYFDLPVLAQPLTGNWNMAYAGVGCAIAGVATASIIRGTRGHCSKLDSFPTITSGSLLGSCWDGWRFMINAAEMMQKGYEKRISIPFKIADRYRWMVIVSSQKQIEELVGAPPEVFSLLEAVNGFMNIRYTMGHELQDNAYHIEVIRARLTRNFGMEYTEIRDEIVTAFDEVLGLQENGWKGVPALDAIQKVVCRTSNRLFIGLPLCRNQDYIDLNIQYTIEVVKAGTAIGLFPKFMRPLVAFFFTGAVTRDKMRALKYLGPIIEERLRYLDECGREWEGQPNDLLSWLIEEARGPELTVRALTMRVLAVNFASIHTTATSFTHALYFLAANPQYLQPLREEVETIVEENGWTKAAIDKMRKVDSFLKESQRLKSANLGVQRMAIEDFTFSDGTFVPKGTTMGIPTRSLHLDDALYENAQEFQPFRFSDNTGDGVGAGVRNQFASTTIKYLAFGHGKHVCPGRFLAANELKSMLAHIVVTYDVKLKDKATYPPSLHVGALIQANPHAQVLFRKRVG